jgi:hypothetical protein
MTYLELADRVLRISKGLRTEALKYLYEAEKDFIIKTQITQKTWNQPVTPANGTITDVADSAISGYALFTSPAHGRSVNDYVQVYGTTGYNGWQQITIVDDANSFTTDHAYGSAEASISAFWQYGFMFDLPSDYAGWVRVEWRGSQINPINQNDYDFSAQTDGFQLLEGSAYTFWIEGDRFRLVPAPTDTSAIVMAYSNYDTTTTPTSPIIPTLYHKYLIDYAIATMLEVAGDKRDDKYWAKYNEAVTTVCVNNALNYLH